MINTINNQILNIKFVNFRYCQKRVNFYKLSFRQTNIIRHFRILDLKLKRISQKKIKNFQIEIFKKFDNRNRVLKQLFIKLSLMRISTIIMKMNFKKKTSKRNSYISSTKINIIIKCIITISIIQTRSKISF